MFRFLKIIVLFILGYKVIRMIFAENKPKQTVPPSPIRQNIHPDNFDNNKTTTPNTKFNDAEFIDFEEVK